MFLVILMRGRFGCLSFLVSVNVFFDFLLLILRRMVLMLSFDSVVSLCLSVF